MISLTLLNAGLRATVKNLIRDRSQGNFAYIAEDLTAIPPVPAQTAWKKFKKELVANVSNDPQAKYNLIQMFGDIKTFIKPIDVSIQDHETRIGGNCDYIDILPGVKQRNLTREEIRNIFFNTFPKIWQDSFKIHMKSRNAPCRRSRNG